MEVMGFKTFVESALESTIQKTVAQLLNENTDVVAAKKAAGSRSVLDTVKSSLDGLVNECIETSKLAINDAVFADFIHSKLQPHANDAKNALLEARYDTPNERAVLTGKHEGLQAVLTALPQLVEHYRGLSSTSVNDLSSSGVEAHSHSSACESDTTECGGRV